jgi:predicted Rossmann fold flavoprotein
MIKKRLVVIGGGAAGFFCAVNAARLNNTLEVILLEKTSKLLSKVRISGGGRCNVTHHLFDIPSLSKRYPRGQNFVKKTFHQFGPEDTIKWFEERGVKIKAEKDGRMFPVTDSSETIIECLLKEANKYGVQIRMNAEVKGVKINNQHEESGNKQFELSLGNSEKISADYVCIACGGYPKLSMFQWLQDIGHTIAPPVPSLFTFNLPKHPINELMGVSVEKVKVKIGGSKLQEEGPVLITHWGLSGPSILRLSAWGARELEEKRYEFKVHINWLPEYNEQTLKVKLQELRSALASKKVSNSNFTQLPGRLWKFILEHSGVNEEMRFADLPAKVENALIRHLVDYVVDVKGKTTFKEEFVTAGGVQLSEVDANTMMSKKIQNVFFAGEILDVDGITGGFNFQHAWASGWIAANAISS